MAKGVRREIWTACLAAIVALLVVASPAFACTTLTVRDSSDNVYLGRTLEMALEFPYQVTYFPPNQRFTSQDGSAPEGLDWTSKNGILGITISLADNQVGDLKVVDGLNDQGMTFSMLAFTAADGPEVQRDHMSSALAAIDLGAWTLGQFSTVAEVKTALENEPVILTSLALLGNQETPFHYVLHDKTGQGIVVEYFAGKQTIYDNPANVMTNGPQFSWHMTNLDNYTFLNNVDRNTSTFGAFDAEQPGAGIATEGLPGSNTAVGRFVRAAYYSQYAEVTSNPDEAVRTLAHVMNNFDRPLNTTTDATTSGASEALEVSVGTPPPDATENVGLSEYTTWTSLMDLTGGRYFVRTYEAMNFTEFDLASFKDVMAIRSIPLAETNGFSINGNDLLQSAS